MTVRDLHLLSFSPQVGGLPVYPMPGLPQALSWTNFNLFTVLPPWVTPPYPKDCSATSFVMLLECYFRVTPSLAVPPFSLGNYSPLCVPSQLDVL